MIRTLTLGLCWAASLFVAASANAQSPVPIRTLAPAQARATRTFGTILGVRALANGDVLVNDGSHRQIVRLDQTLTKATVVLDSAVDGGASYGPGAAPFVPYLGDSTLFLDGNALALLVLDPAGRVARVMAAPKPRDLRMLAGSASGIDPRGNLVYRGALAMFTVPATAGAPQYNQWADSAPIVRANFDSRTVDTLGHVRMQVIARYNFSRDGDGRIVRRATVSPVLTPDEWAVLSDGSIAFVRGRDYRVDWLLPDGTRASSPKLPFDWRRITDSEKRQLTDSARTVVEAVMAANASGTAPASSAAAGIAPPGPVSPPVLQFTEIPDYYPPIREGAVKADLDGNLWILPTTSAQSDAGELVYDVVNRAAGLTHRVRVPAGRSIAGFGPHGVVFLMSGSKERGWTLERTSVAQAGANK